MLVRKKTTEKPNILSTRLAFYCSINLIFKVRFSIRAGELETKNGGFFKKPPFFVLIVV